MNISIKHFSELSALQVYQIVHLRNQIFVVEQNCVYLDTDKADLDALHVLVFDVDCLVAYARLIKPGVKYPESSIGRVVVHTAYRKKNLGHLLMQHAVKAVKDFYNTTHITISAQAHLQGFYEKHGFKTVSDTYLEDGIPHVQMRTENLK